jgi:ribosomal protein S21
VRVTPGAPIQFALSMLRRRMADSGTMNDTRRKEFYTKPGAARRLKSVRARRRLVKALRKRTIQDADWKPFRSPTSARRTA